MEGAVFAASFNRWFCWLGRTFWRYKGKLHFSWYDPFKTSTFTMVNLYTSVYYTRHIFYS